MLYPIFHEIIVSVLGKNPGVIRDCVSVIKSLRNVKNSITQNDIFNAVTAYDISNKAETRIWRMVIDKVIVRQGHLLEFKMMDESKMEYRMMVTSPRMNKPTKCAEEDIYNDYISGYRTDFLAQKYGFKLTTIRRIIKEYSK
jgi:hypothetical protein